MIGAGLVDGIFRLVGGRSEVVGNVGRLGIDRLGGDEEPAAALVEGFILVEGKTIVVDAFVEVLSVGMLSEPSMDWPLTVAPPPAPAEAPIPTGGLIIRGPARALDTSPPIKATTTC